jgi:hypothetical protein
MYLFMWQVAQPVGDRELSNTFPHFFAPRRYCRQRLDMLARYARAAAQHAAPGSRPQHVHTRPLGRRPRSHIFSSFPTNPPPPLTHHLTTAHTTAHTTTAHTTAQTAKIAHY